MTTSPHDELADIFEGMLNKGLAIPESERVDRTWGWIEALEHVVGITRLHKLNASMIKPPADEATILADLLRDARRLHALSGVLLKDMTAAQRQEAWALVNAGLSYPFAGRLVAMVDARKT